MTNEELAAIKERFDAHNRKCLYLQACCSSGDDAAILLAEVERPTSVIEAERARGRQWSGYSDQGQGLPL